MCVASCSATSYTLTPCHVDPRTRSCQPATVAFVALASIPLLLISLAIALPAAAPGTTLAVAAPMAAAAPTTALAAAASACVVSSATSTVPSSAPAVPGLYGDLGGIDLTGPKGAGGQYIDLPEGHPDVAALFQAALAHLWGFNNVEALRGFRTAAALAPDCALCHWGIAQSLAPNINYGIEDQAAFNVAVRDAARLAAEQPLLTSKTKHLIASIQSLVAAPPATGNVSAYAHALCGNVTDADTAAMCANAAMAATPWNYYEGEAGGSHFPLKPKLRPIKTMLLDHVRGGDGGTPHAFTIHLLIHLMEPTNAPASFRWQAVEAAQALYSTHGEALAPAQGHLTHMPAHLFLRVGRYASGVDTSLRTEANNQRYLSRCLHPYAHGHNLKMLTALARFAGMSAIAMEGARNVTSALAGPELTPAGKVACIDCAGPSSPEAVLTLARFARWEEVLSEAVPRTWGDEGAYNEAAFRLARALAMYALADGRTAERADAEAARAINASAKSEWAEVVQAELEAARAWRIEGDGVRAAGALAKAVAAVDKMPYMEPPRWYYPPRQCLGYVLRASNATASLAAFTRDLHDFPENGWSLSGAADALDALGRGAEAEGHRERAAVAWQFADVWQPRPPPCPQLSA